MYFLFQVRYFYDFTPEGSLWHILSAMYKFKFDQGWRRFDLTSPSKKDSNIEMCKAVSETNIVKIFIVVKFSICRFNKKMHYIEKNRK